MGKTDNLTIRVEPDLKKRADFLREKYYKRVPLNIFLEIMLEYGMDVQEKIGEYERDIYVKSIDEKVRDYIEKRNADDTYLIIGDEERKEGILKKRKKAEIHGE